MKISDQLYKHASWRLKTYGQSDFTGEFLLDISEDLVEQEQLLENYRKSYENRQKDN